MTARRTACALMFVSLLVTRPVQVRVSAQRVAAPLPERERPAPAVDEPSLVTIRINVVVTDRRGRPVLDLKPADFELHDDGVLQSLSSVELRTPEKPVAPAGAPGPAEDVRGAAREPETRVFAIFLDEFNVAPGVNSARVRDAMTRFLTESVRPRDLLYVMKPMTPVSQVRFTRDRGAAQAEIASFEGRKGDYAPRSAFEEEYIGRTPAAVAGARAQIVTTDLRELTMAVGDLQPARAAVVLVSEGFSRAPGRERVRLPDWETLARAASHFNLPIYTIDPGDPVPPEPVPPEAEDRPTPRPDRDRTTLDSLAERTGGEAVRDPDRMAPALARMSRDLDAYYVLMYQPSRATDGRFHPISVKTRRKEAELRVPTGYWSPLSAEWRSYLDKVNDPLPPLEPTRMLKRSPFIDTWYGFQRTADGRMEFLFTWEPSAAGAALRARPNAVALTVTMDGTTLYDNDVRQIAPPGTEGAGDRALVEAATAGRLQLDFAVRAADGTVIDKGAQDIEVPAPRSHGPMLLPPQFVRTTSARDFRLLSTQADAAPTPSRTFRRGERVLVRVPAYNPDGAPVDITVSLLNVKSQLIRPLDRLPLAGTGVPLQFDLPLAFLAPGEYTIDVKVASATGTARQLVKIRLIG